MPHQRVLVVDDNAMNLKLLRITLALDGHDVRTAVSAEDALDVMREFSPTMMLVDVQLPGMSGLDLVHLLRESPATGDICMIAVSAFAMRGHAERARAAGCDGYVTKPIDAAHLRGEIAACVSRRAQRRGGA